MSADRPEYRVGLARALIDADPDTPIGELGDILADVSRDKCTDCGRQTFSRPARCVCGGTEFEKIVPSKQDGGRDE